MTPSPEQDGIRKEFEAWAQDVRGESDVSELEPAGWTVWLAAYAAGMRAQREKDAKIAKGMCEDVDSNHWRVACKDVAAAIRRQG